jgi:hypothetical protein
MIPVIIFIVTKNDLLAQLGEHYLDRVGVSGSSPLQVISTGSLEPLWIKAFFIDTDIINILIQNRFRQVVDGLLTVLKLLTVLLMD